MEACVKERHVPRFDIETVMPRDLINAKRRAAAVREFFARRRRVAINGTPPPDQSAVKITNKAASRRLAPASRRERAGFRGARRASDALRPSARSRRRRPPHSPITRSDRPFARASTNTASFEIDLSQGHGGRVTDEVNLSLGECEEGAAIRWRKPICGDRRQGRFTDGPRGLPPFRRRADDHAGQVRLQ